MLLPAIKIICITHPWLSYMVVSLICHICSMIIKMFIWYMSARRQWIEHAPRSFESGIQFPLSPTFQKFLVLCLHWVMMSHVSFQSWESTASMTSSWPNVLVTKSSLSSRHSMDACGKEAASVERLICDVIIFLCYRWRHSDFTMCETWRYLWHYHGHYLCNYKHYGKTTSSSYPSISW